MTPHAATHCNHTCRNEQKTEYSAWSSPASLSRLMRSFSAANRSLTARGMMPADSDA